MPAHTPFAPRIRSFLTGSSAVTRPSRLARASEVLLAFGAMLLPIPRVQAQTSSANTHWVSSWGTAQQIPEPQNALSAADLTDTMLRQVVHLSLGGSQLCLHLSNAFGTAPLHLSAVHIARPVSPAVAAIVPGTDTAVTFAGQPDVTIPAGAEYLSDPIRFAAAPSSDLAISIHYDDPPTQETSHPGSRATSYVVHGDQVAAPDSPGAKTVEHWYQIAGVDVASTPDAASVVALGDSITDGHAATTNGNDRWPDVLARRLLADTATRNLAVVNAGIGGGRVLLDGSGPNALARFDRDVLARPGAQYLIMLEGVNDLGTFTRLAEKSAAQHEVLVEHLIAAYAQLVLRAHARGIEVFGATITPYAGSDYYHPGPLSEHDRQALNAWIRTPGHFDGVVDFDKTIADPAHPDHLLPAFDSGDHLHPSPAGYRAMGEAIPLSLFRQTEAPFR